MMWGLAQQMGRGGMRIADFLKFVRAATIAGVNRGSPIEEVQMDLGLSGRNAVILGGTRGIGRAIAGALAAEGAGVAVCARNAEQVRNAVAELQNLGARATGASVDITDGAALKTWIENVAQEFGGIDMLFSNAGAMAQGGDPASWDQNFRLDVLGAVNAFEAARPFLEASGEKSGDAAFVIISSISAAQADTASSYGPVKAALIHFAKGLARQHAGKKIRVNVVSPGTVYFKGGVWNTIEQNMPKRYEEALARNPTGRMATPQEIANSAVFLASPASSFTTGSNLVVDGAISNRVNF
jgi:3-oxoacyl-[acyl-carrier protein] reductase